MEEKTGLLKSLEVLGAKVDDLENDLRYVRLRKEQLEEDVQRLRSENDRLEKKLDEVKDYFKLGQE